jgi:Flp pilus assembly protein TadD
MLLREAVLLDPLLEDAYESLGVVLHRQGRTEEAIEVMRTLKRLNPDSVMARSNLSVFYVSLGRIEEAEQEKAQGALLQFRQDEAARKAARSEEEERARKWRETEERLGLFLEVLDMDPDDLLANYGAGGSLLALGRAGEALPLLEKAVELQPDYSAAWLHLGQALEALGRADDAAGAYRNGIAAASARGDLQPLQAMRQRLAALETSA